MSRDRLNRPECGEPAGSARESWISRVSACKSLIPERTAAARGAGFAMCQAVFATSQGFAPAAPVSFFLLFNSLKKKKKDNREAAGNARHESCARRHRSPALPVFRAMSLAGPPRVNDGN
ncbi:hypothetical protein [Burkholderia ubonensis]|uniref:hypothetical protein n=1 Tax=Burkholderia ubonensis TaxID=101571 RepID=UPI000A90858E|nr:hypothetical protein [Burkholderia ubonensis]